MVSFHEFQTGDHGPLCLSIHHHGFFSPIQCTKPWITLSLYYNTIVSSHQFSAQDNEPLSLSLNTIASSHQCHALDQWALSVYTTPWSFLTHSIHEIMDHFICLYITMVSSHQFYTWDHGPPYLAMQHHGIFSPISYMRQWTTLSVYTTWSTSIWSTRVTLVTRVPIARCELLCNIIILTFWPNSSSTHTMSRFGRVE
jgi:hypothetical protein